MSKDYEFPELNRTVIVDNETGMQPVIAESSGYYQYAKRIDYAVFEPSVENGIMEIRNTNGDVLWTVNTDGVQVHHLEWGDTGYEVATGDELQVLVSGSVERQASVSVKVSGYKSFQSTVKGMST